MPNLFSTFGRAALVAFGLSIAPAAFAQSTASCPNGMAPVWTGDGSPLASYVCALTCTGGQVAQVSGNSVSCVTGGGGPVAPSGCKIVANPTTGASGTNVQLTLSCTSGDLPVTIAWGGIGQPNGCPTSLSSGLSANCTVSNVTATTTWTVSQFSNAAGNGVGNSNKTATFTVQSGGGGEFANCPSDATIMTLPNGGFGSSLRPIFTQGSMTVYKLVVPTTATQTGPQKNAWVEFNGGGTYSYAVSTKACSLDPLDAIPAVTSGGALYPNGLPLMFNTSSSVFSFYWKFNVNMMPGQTYYFNLRNNSCGGTCGENGDLKKFN